MNMARTPTGNALGRQCSRIGNSGTIFALAEPEFMTLKRQDFVQNLVVAEKLC
jgi:hypothetical protein